jgi:hypothetical protein
VLVGDGSKVRVGVMTGKRFLMVSGDTLGDGKLGGLRMGDGSKVRVGVMMGKRFSMVSGDTLGDGKLGWCRWVNDW